MWPCQLIALSILHAGADSEGKIQKKMNSNLFFLSCKLNVDNVRVLHHKISHVNYETILGLNK